MESVTRRQALAMLGGIAALPLIQSLPAFAADGPISILYPGAAGGAVEVALRAIAESASLKLGRTIVVDARGGANGRIAYTAMAKSNENNLALLFANNGVLVTNPLIDGPSGRIEPGKDYVPIGLSLRLKLVLVANPAAPFNDLPSLIAYAKANPGKLKCGMVGSGSNTQLSLELLKAGAGIDITAVPYRGEAQAIPDILSGVIQLAFASSTAKPYVENGQLKGIATTGSERWRVFPNLPTMREAGVAKFEVAPYFGVIAPTSISPQLVAQLVDAFATAAKDPKVIAAIDRNGLDPDPTTPEVFGEIIRKDLAFWAPIIASAGIKAE